MGDLGAGKTTFVRGLAGGLKSSDQVASPTFTINRIYRAGNLRLSHYDFYRLKGDAGIMRDQLAESLDDPLAITVVEWAGAVDDVLPSQRFIIDFKPVALDPDHRQISIKYPQSMTEVVEKLENDWGQG